MTFTLPEPPVRGPEWPEILPPRLSPSSITKFLGCPEKWRREYLVGESGRSSGALVIGSADSEAAAFNFRAKSLTGDDLPLVDVQDAARDALIVAVGKEDVEWDQNKDGEKNYATALDTAIRVVTFNHKAEYPLVALPTHVEEPVEFQVEGAPLVRAYVDVATNGFVVSRKTAGRAPSGVTRTWAIQSAIESAALGRPSVYHVTTKGAKPRLICPETDGDEYRKFSDVEKTREFAAQVISTASRGIRAMLNEFGPDEPWVMSGAGHWGAHPGGGLSMCKLCDFKDRGCPVWRQ